MVIMVVFPVIGRILIDFWGLQCAIAIFASVPVIAQILFGFPQASGVLVFLCNEFRLHRIAQSCLWVGRTTMLAKWFRNKTLSLAMAIILSLSRLRDVFYELETENIDSENNESQGGIHPIRLCICIFSFLSALVLVYIDKKASLRRLEHFKDPREPKRFRLKNLKQFPRIYYLMIGIICVFSFPVSINLRYQGSRQHISWYFYIFFVLIGLPLVGFLTDRLGKRLHGILVNFLVILTLAFVLLIQLGYARNQGVLVLMAPISVAAYLFEVISWPCIGLVVEQKLTGTAYAIANSLKNLALFSVLQIIDWSKGSTICQVVLVGILGIVGGVIIGRLYHEDKKEEKVLDKPAHKVKIPRV